MAAFSLFGAPTTRKQASAVPKRGSRGPLPLPRLHELQCRACPLNEAHVKSPKMAPTGSEAPVLYILGEAPGKTDDETPQEHIPSFGGHKVRQFLGRAGQRLRSEIPAEWRKHIRWNNVIQDRLPGRQKAPDSVETECCRKRIEADIIATKPKAVLALGGAAAWFGASGGINLWRGTRFPFRLGGHSFWVYPAFHPTFVVETEATDRFADPVAPKIFESDNVPQGSHRTPEKRGSNQMDQERIKLWPGDLARVFKDLDDLPEPQPLAEEDFLKDACFFTGEENDGIARLVRALARLDPELVTTDVETKELRPYAAGAKLLSIAFSDGARSVGIAIEHPGAKWTNLAMVWGAILDFLKRVKLLAAHRALFDAEWIVDRLFFFDGEAILFRRWEDTQAQAYVLNGDKGALSLNVRTLLFFGLPIKELSDVDRKKLHTFPILTVLRYNVLDAEVTARLFHEQVAELRRRGQWKVYRFHMRRLPALVLAQRRGALVDQARVKEYQAVFAAKLKEIEGRLNNDPDVLAFRRVNGPVNFGSNKQMVKFFHGHLHRSEVKRGDSYSVDDAVLTALVNAGVRVASILADYRQIVKLKGTYLDSYVLGAPGAEVYPDGRLHTTYSDTGTDTSRLASTDPNLQNFPSREYKELRNIVVAG